MRRVPIHVSWSCDYVPPNACTWALYVSKTAGDRGECVARPWLESRTHLIHLEEGTWHVRVVMAMEGCREESWQRVEQLRVVVTGRETAPQRPANVGLAPVSHDLAGAIQHDPMPVSGQPCRMQAIEVDGDDDPGLGILRDEYDVEPGGAVQDAGRVTHPIRLDGSAASVDEDGHTPAERTIAVRPIGLLGRPGPEARVDSVLAERLGFRETVLAYVDTAAATTYHMPGTSPIDGLDYLPAEGYRTAAMPAMTDPGGWAALGAVEDWTQPLTPYFRETWIVTDETDLQRVQVFVMECFARIRRKSPGALGSTPVWALSMPVGPVEHHPDQEPHPYRDDPTALSPYYLMRDTVVGADDMLPRNPLRYCRWEVRADNATPITNPWQPYVPGMWMQGRYVQARLRLYDPSGWWQVVTGDVVVRARHPLRRFATTVAWAGTEVAPGSRVTLPLHPITGGSLFPNAMQVQATPHGVAGTQFGAPTVSGQGAGAAFVDVALWDAAGALQALPDSIDVLVTGY